MKIQAFVAVAMVGAAVSGCATIIKGSGQDIAVNSTPVEGAECVMHSSEGTWRLTTPGSAHVDKSKNDIKLTCTKVGYQDTTDTIPSGFQGWTLGNLLLGGVIGLGVDAATGSINEYPQTVTVQMTPVARSAAVRNDTPISTPSVLPPPVQPTAAGAPSS